MHMVNLSGLATYVNCPEITADHAPIQWLSLTGGSPVRHAARSGRRRGARPNPAIPGGTPERRGGRLPRYSGPGSVPLARGPGRARDPGLDRGGESPDRELAVRDPATRDDPQATDRAVELSQVRRAVPQSGSVLLLQERRPAEPVGALQAGLARGRSRSAARPEPPVRRRHDRALHARGLGGRPVARLRDAGERLGLGGVPRARRRDVAGPVRSPALDQVPAGFADGRRRRVLLQSLPRGGRQGADDGETLPEAVLPPSRHRPGAGHAGVRAGGPARLGVQRRRDRRRPLRGDRKSTRLNSSHGYISYAVFCLKKKPNDHNYGQRYL